MASSNTELSPDRIRALGLAFRQTRVLLSAVELGLFGELIEAPLDAETLTQRLGLHPRGTRDFLDTLVALGLLEREDGQYSNTPETATFLDPAKPSYVGDGFAAGAYTSWSQLTDALRTGQPQTDGGWEAVYETPEAVRGLTRYFTARAHDAMQVVAQRFPWENRRSLIDIGTSAGDLPVQVALAHAHITGGGFDLPQVGPAFDEYVASFGMTERLRFYPGNFFTDSLPSADVLTMSNVLHDWGLEERRMLLSKAHAALPEGGILVVLEEFIDDDRRTNLPALLMSLQMLMTNPGGNFSAAECCTWMREVGFSSAEVVDLGDSVAVAVATK